MVRSSGGEDLFIGYEEWFLETVRAACANEKANWIVKIHPENIVKNRRDGVPGEPSEVVAIREHIGDLPSHVVMLDASTDISTYSLFQIMDYCLTVWGTVGIEAVSFGVPVLTAGIGHYEYRGFTVDSDSRTEYLSRLAPIHEQPLLSAHERKLASASVMAHMCHDPCHWKASHSNTGVTRKPALEYKSTSVRLMIGKTLGISNPSQLESGRAGRIIRNRTSPLAIQVTGLNASLQRLNVQHHRIDRFSVFLDGTGTPGEIGFLLPDVHVCYVDDHLAGRADRMG